MAQGLDQQRFAEAALVAVHQHQRVRRLDKMVDEQTSKEHGDGVDQVGLTAPAEVLQQAAQDRRQAVQGAPGRRQRQGRQHRVKVRGVDQDAGRGVPAGLAQLELVIEHGTPRVAVDSW